LRCLPMDTRHCGRACPRRPADHGATMSNFFRTALQRITAWIDRLLRPRWARWLLLPLAMHTVLLLGFTGNDLCMLKRNVPVTPPPPPPHVHYTPTHTGSP